MTRTTDQRIRQASLREEWSVSSVQRLAWAMGRSPAAPAAVRRAAAGMPGRSVSGVSVSGASAPLAKSHDPARRIRLIQALGRVAADTTASVAERKLAEQRLAELRTSYATAC